MIVVLIARAKHALRTAGAYACVPDRLLHFGGIGTFQLMAMVTVWFLVWMT